MAIVSNPRQMVKGGSPRNSQKLPEADPRVDGSGLPGSAGGLHRKSYESPTSHWHLRKVWALNILLCSPPISSLLAGMLASEGVTEASVSLGSSYTIRRQHDRYTLGSPALQVVTKAMTRPAWS